MPGTLFRPNARPIHRRRWGSVTTYATGGLPPPVVIIPWTWLLPPFSLRADQPINHAEITQAGANTAVSDNTTSQAGGVFPATGTLTTPLVADAQNFASWITTYYANSLVRPPTVTLDLVPRTDAERLTILSVELGQRVTLGPGVDSDGNTTVGLPVPTTLPASAVTWVVEGVVHESSSTSRLVIWNTSALLGSTPGTEGPWFRTSDSPSASSLDGTDAMPF